MEEIWNKYKQTMQISQFEFERNAKMYKQIFFDAFSLGEQSSLAERAEKETENKEKINRVEVIQKDKGRVYTNYNVKSCEIQEQDNGETLKIFLNYEKTY